MQTIEPNPIWSHYPHGKADPEPRVDGWQNILTALRPNELYPPVAPSNNVRLVPRGHDITNVRAAVLRAEWDEQ